MKNKKALQNVVQFVKSELEVTLAVLILFAFVVGYSFAQTPESPTISSTDPAPASEAPTSSDVFVIGGKEYKGISFHKRVTGFYRATQFSGGAMNTSDNGLTTVNPDATYIMTVNLDLPLSSNGRWYADVDGADVEVNGSKVTNKTQPINIAGSKTITIKIKGQATIRTISKTIPSAQPQMVITPSIGSLYIAPTLTTLTPNTTRNFLLVAVDQDGNTMATDGVKWSSSDTAIAEIDSKYGMVTAKTPGTVVVTATLGTAKASATVTVKAAPVKEEAKPQTSTSTSSSAQTPAKQMSPTAPTTEQSASTPTSPVETKSASVTVDEAANNLFKAETVAARSATTGMTHASQKEINETSKQLPTLSQKVTFRIKTAVKDIATSIREMVKGYEVTDGNGNVENKPGVIKTIFGFLGKLVGDPKAGGAAPTKIKINDDLS